MRSRDQETNYFFLLITIIVGVTLGNLLSNFITARAIAYQAQQAAIEVNQVLQAQAQQMQAASIETRQQNAARLTANQEALRRQRANDLNGVKLSQSRSEWKRADMSLNSYTTHAEAAKFCNRYEQYLQTGQLEGGK